jgi:uridine kinase
MRLPSTPATELQRALRDEARSRFPGGRVVVAVDGADPAAFAKGLADVYREGGIAVFQAHIGDFQRSRADRARETGAGRYDVATMRRVLIDPFRDAARTSATTGFQLVAFDAARDMTAAARWVTGPADATLLVDGADLLDARLESLWDWRIDLSADAASAADAVIDVTDPDDPKRVR